MEPRRTPEDGPDAATRGHGDAAKVGEGVREGEGFSFPSPSPSPTASSRGIDGRVATSACYLFGVVRARGWRGGPGGEAADLVKVPYRDLEALARPVPFLVPQLDRAGLIAHQRVVEGAMRRGTVLPAPPGVVFRGRRLLIRFLEDQYLVLDEGLAFLEGHWELRLHLAAARSGEPEPELRELAIHIYSEMRRFARAAIPFPHEERHLLGAAFLVGRNGWVDFIERAEDLGTTHPELSVDVTGPWPPYDFIKMTL